MKKMLNISNFGIITSLIYIGFIALLRFPFSIKTLMTIPINELGDFLAGIFGPLTLFWLILGFILQKKELSQNTAALNMQAKELKESVEQHKEMVEITRKQVEAEIAALQIQKEKIDRSVLPRFVITEIKTETRIEKSENVVPDFGDGHINFKREEILYHIFFVEILNEGASVTDFDVQAKSNRKDLNTNWPHGNHLVHNEKIVISWTDKEDDAPEEVDIWVHCFDSLGRSISRRFELALGDGPEYHNFTMPHDKETYHEIILNTQDSETHTNFPNILKHSE